MAQVRHLRNPPIQEAVIDIKTDVALCDQMLLDKIAESLKAPGWRKKTLTTHEAKFSLDGDESGATLRADFAGYVLEEPNGAVIIQVRKDGVTVSHVRQYAEWDDLEADAEKAFNTFLSFVHPKKLTRVAARYINRIPFPSQDFDDFGQLMMIHPQVPDSLSGAKITDFLHQQVIKEIEGGFTANLTIATIKPLPGENVSSLLVDVDVFKECTIEASFDVAKLYLRQIRDRKNDIFFGIVTEQALEKFI